MLRYSIAIVLLATISSVMFAQQKPVMDGDGEITVLFLTPQPMPTLKSDYYLKAGYTDKEPGNAVLAFYQARMEQDNFFNSVNEMKRSDALQLSMDDLPKNIRETSDIDGGIAYGSKYSTMMSTIDHAARYTTVEWNDWFGLRKDDAGFLLPGVQKMRQYAGVISLRMRGEIKNSEFQRAVESSKTLLGMSDALDQNPTIVGNLVALAIASINATNLADMIQQKECPNLFWSFVDLPHHIVAIEHGISGDRLLLVNKYKSLMKSDRALSDDEMNKWIAELQADAYLMSWNGVDQPKEKAADVYAAAAKDEKTLTSAQDRLIDNGYKPKLVYAMSPLQQVVMYDILLFQQARDEVLKWTNLPYWQARGPLMREMDKQGYVQRTLFFPDHFGYAPKVKAAQARIDQQYRALQIIEAIRWYAFEHKTSSRTSSPT